MDLIKRAIDLSRQILDEADKTGLDIIVDGERNSLDTFFFRILPDTDKNGHEHVELSMLCKPTLKVGFYNGKADVHFDYCANDKEANTLILELRNKLAILKEAQND